MPRFPVAFSKRKSAAESIDNVAVTPSSGSSFRVLERSEVSGGGSSSKPSDNAPPRQPTKSLTMPNTTVTEMGYMEDNLFVDIKNRGSGSSNTTKGTSTDNSSRHSNASTAPSSADLGQQQQQDEWKATGRKPYSDIPVPPIPKSSTTSSFLKSAGRTFSFGGQRKHHQLSEESVPETPAKFGSRERATTTSTTSTATPPKLDQDFTLDLGGDFGSMLGTFDNRSSMNTIRDESESRPALAPRSLTGNRLNQPSPIQVDHNAKIEASPYSWSSHNSNDQLMNNHSLVGSPTNENAPPVPRHASPFGMRSPGDPPATSPQVGSHDAGLKRSSAVFGGRRRSTIDYGSGEVEDEDAVLLKDSYNAVNRFLAGGSTTATPKASASAGRFRRDEDSPTGASGTGYGTGYRQLPSESTSPRFGSKAVKDDEDNLFDTSFTHSRMNQRFVSARRQSPPRNKVMTPAQFEKYRKDKEREETSKTTDISKVESSDEEEDAYDDDVDEAEKSRQAAKQRRKQEAHMAVYRQQMMKVTGEAATGTPIRPAMTSSASTPNLPSLAGGNPALQNSAENSDEDEEVPLGILAAHGFPNKNRPPARLNSMMSNPNLRSAAGPSYQRPGSAMGDANNGANGGGSNGRLPVFARNLPQDPYGIVQPSVRESLNFNASQPQMPNAQVAGPAATAPPPPPVAPGGLVGVIASEERSRALRRGSPNMDAVNKMSSMTPPGQQVDPMAGIPPQMMYPNMMPPPMLTPGDQAQIQMTQQMGQFMQMQMQFMQMMAANNRPTSQYGGTTAPSMAGPDMMRHSFADAGGSQMDMSGRPDMQHMRTMSMVQPSSASWVQPPPNPGYAPSIRVQGVNGYAASIAPSERSNIGLPGRYRPVSQMPAGPNPNELRQSISMSGGAGPRVNGNSGSASPGASSDSQGPPSPTGLEHTRKTINRSPLNNATNVDDDDDEQGWAAMKAKRDKKRSLWKSRKSHNSNNSEQSAILG